MWLQDGVGLCAGLCGGATVCCGHSMGGWGLCGSGDLVVARGQWASSVPVLAPLGTGYWALSSCPGLEPPLLPSCTMGP